MLHIELPSKGKIDVQHTLSVLGLHSLANQEVLDLTAGTVRRILRVNGALLEITVHLLPTGAQVSWQGSPRDAPELSTIINHWLGLQQENTPGSTALAHDPLMTRIVAIAPDIRVISYPDLFEALAITILGQQISTTAARTLAYRYVDTLGETHPSGLKAFPDAITTAGTDPLKLQQIIRCPATRALTLHRVACWYQESGATLRENQDEFLRQLLALKGVGPWTRDYVALRGLRHPGILLRSDLVVRRALRKLGHQGDVAALDWDENNSAATIALWNADAQDTF